MIMDYTTLQVGQEVAVAKRLGWSTQNQGVYVVNKVNKVKVTVCRKSDGYLRTFSVKKRCELGDFVEDTYRAAFLETVAEQEARIAQHAREVEVRAAWREAERAAVQKNLVLLKQIVADLEEMSV
jgi:hypothetical protein